MKFCLFGDCVLVCCVEEVIKIVGGIIILDIVIEKLQEGEVFVVGNGVIGDDNECVLFDVKFGDKILFGKWGGIEVKIDGEDLLIMKESDIMGVIEG